MEIKGNLKQILPPVTKGKYTSQKIWLTIPDEKYPQVIELEGKESTWEGVAIGAPICCHINLRGREWTNPEGKVIVFNTLQCWKVVADPGGWKPVEDELPQPGFPAAALPEDSSDLPF